MRLRNRALPRASPIPARSRFSRSSRKRCATAGRRAMRRKEGLRRSRRSPRDWQAAGANDDGSAVFLQSRVLKNREVEILVPVSGSLDHGDALAGGDADGGIAVIPRRAIWIAMRKCPPPSQTVWKLRIQRRGAEETESAAEEHPSFPLRSSQIPPPLRVEMEVFTQSVPSSATRPAANPKSEIRNPKFRPILFQCVSAIVSVRARHAPSQF